VKVLGKNIIEVERASSFLHQWLKDLPDPYTAEMLIAKLFLDDQDTRIGVSWVGVGYLTLDVFLHPLGG
jgi:hypothetical protein